METSVTSSLLWGEKVERAQELGRGLGGSWTDDNHSTADLLTLDTTEQETRVVTSLDESEGLLESLHTGNDRLDGFLVVANDFDFLVDVELTTLDTSRGDGTTTSDREDV